jgi:hypothetical protein
MNAFTTHIECSHHHGFSFSSLGSNDELTTTPTRRAAGHCMGPKQSADALLPLHRQLPQTAM